MNDKEKFEKEALAEFIEMTGIPKERIDQYGEIRRVEFQAYGETYELKNPGLAVVFKTSSPDGFLPVLYFSKKPHDISEPVLSHSETSGLIYVYFGGEKYEITKQCVEAVEAIKVLNQKPCEDTISRKEAIDTIRQLYLDLASQKAVIDILKVLPSVTPQETRKGHWEHGKELSKEYQGRILVDVTYEDWHCSECHCAIEESIKPKWNYCPNCGAKMVESQESEEES